MRLDLSPIWFFLSGKSQMTHCLQQQQQQESKIRPVTIVMSGHFTSIISIVSSSNIPLTLLWTDKGEGKQTLSRSR